jgi:glycosyltransferase involved in cell wall biosynthesis
MRVLLATTLGFGIGGVRSHIFTLKKALETKNHQVNIVYPPGVKTFTRLLIGMKALGNRDIARVELTRWRQQKVYNRLKTLIDSFDVLHAHDALLLNYVPKDGPLVLTVHGPLSREAMMSGKGSPKFLQYLKEQEAKAYERATAIIAVDSGQKEIICEDYNINPEKVYVIYNAVDTDFFAPNDTGLEEVSSSLFFLVPRRLVPKNGVHIAIEAMKYVKAPVQLWIAGDGKERKNLERLVSTHGLEEKVKFLGFVNSKEMVSLMNQALGIIIPSIPVSGVIEASSISALEGMSIGKPVIASNIGGLQEIVKDRQTGLLFEPGNAKQLAELMQFIIDDPNFAKAVGDNARSYVIENHSLNIWVEKVIEVYNIVLK